MRLHHALPIAKALLIRPDYAAQLAAVLPYYQSETFAEKAEDTLVQVSIITTVAAIIVASRFVNFPDSKLLGTALFGAGLVSNVGSVLTGYFRKRTNERRLEGGSVCRYVWQ